VVIPTYNRAAAVCDALLSVQRQTFEDFEIVVVDDGSSDETCERVGALAREDRRIRLLTPGHGGVAKARNAGIAAPGAFEYVAFLDADDLWTPDHLDAAVSIMRRREDVALVYGAFETVDHSGHWTSAELAAREQRFRNAARLSAKEEAAGAFVLESPALLGAFLRNEVFPLTSTTVIRASSVPGGVWFDPTLLVLEDGDLFLRLIATGRPWAFLDRRQATAHYFGDNLTRARDLSSPVTLARLRSQLHFTMKKLAHCRSAADRLHVRREIAQQAYGVGQCSAEQLDREGARSAYIGSFRARPNYLAAKGLVAATLPTGLASFVRRVRRLAAAEL
jgi:glycosyltransferase involved in cell wall biosynthesis